MEYLIEDKHPIPSREYQRRPASPETTTFRKMSHGQSFLIKCEEKRTIKKHINKLYQESKRLGNCKAVFRKEQNGWRVWKVEMKDAE